MTLTERKMYNLSDFEHEVAIPIAFRTILQHGYCFPTYCPSNDSYVFYDPTFKLTITAVRGTWEMSSAPTPQWVVETLTAITISSQKSAQPRKRAHVVAQPS